jgi:hypothetical protein
MYNFDAASFPEFTYIKTHMLQNDLTPLAHSSTLVDAFLKNFEQGLATLNILQSRSEILHQPLSMPVIPTVTKPKSSRHLRLNHLFSKSSSKLTCSSESRSATTTNCDDPTSPPISSVSSGRFLNIYRNSKQSHSTSELNSSEPCTSHHKSSSANSNQDDASPPRNRPKSHLYDFYSYYNNKYNVENQRRRQSTVSTSGGQSRSASISTATNSIVQQLRMRRGSKPVVPLKERQAGNEYFIAQSSQFNMKKFASSL